MFGFAGEAMQAAADVYASDMEALGGWLSDVTGLEIFDDGTTILARSTREQPRSKRVSAH